MPALCGAPKMPVGACFQPCAVVAHHGLIHVVGRGYAVSFVTESRGTRLEESQQSPESFDLQPQELTAHSNQRENSIGEVAETHSPGLQTRLTAVRAMLPLYVVA